MSSLRMMSRHLRYPARTIPSIPSFPAGPTTAVSTITTVQVTANRRFLSSSSSYSTLSFSSRTSCFVSRNTKSPTNFRTASVGCMSSASVGVLRQLITHSSSRIVLPQLQTKSRNFFTSAKNMSCTFPGAIFTRNSLTCASN